MKFILTTMAFVAAGEHIHTFHSHSSSTDVHPAAMGTIATPQEAVTITVTVTDCGTSGPEGTGVFSTSIRTITGSATESILPTPVGPVSESVFSSISESATSPLIVSPTGTISVIISSSETSMVVIQSVTSSFIIPNSGTSVETSLLTTAVTSSDLVSPDTASSDFSTSWKTASASETGRTSASMSSRTSATASSTTVPSNDATITSMVGMTCIVAVLAASLFNLA
ncbi:unnamed protein product [Aureobasidium uvarum]|uniref:Uncharacterized protein n=1 Tax=Aureobasidium uvarum TaxID=2773716 RepID=A0A9N8KER4_9PEZI|nr:unnamed protein product [Aureobasidium uvarum]